MNSFGRLCAAALVTLAAGCATAPSEPPFDRLEVKPCPPVRAYTRAEQAEADRELGLILSLSKGRGPCRLCAMLDDFLLMRDQCR